MLKTAIYLRSNYMPSCIANLFIYVTYQTTFLRLICKISRSAGTMP